MRTWVSMMYNRTRKNALTRGIPFEITPEDVRVLAHNAKNRCAVTSIPFDFTESTEQKTKPWRPSLDRKDSSKGYTVDNIRIVCTAVNLAMNVWGEEILHKIVAAMVCKQRNRPHDTYYKKPGQKYLSGVKRYRFTTKEQGENAPRFIAYFKVKGKQKHVGIFDSEIAAHDAARAAKAKYARVAKAIAKTATVLPPPILETVNLPQQNNNIQNSGRNFDSYTPHHASL
jgi:hypothetical protein